MTEEALIAQCHELLRGAWRSVNLARRSLKRAPGWVEKHTKYKIK
jgi:hypothetical protein